MVLIDIPIPFFLLANHGASADRVTPRARDVRKLGSTTLKGDSTINA